MRRKLELSIPVALILLLLPMEACANRVASSAGWQNLLSTCCLSVGFYYLFISAKKIHSIRRLNNKSIQAAFFETGAIYFLVAGILSFAAPFFAFYLHAGWQVQDVTGWALVLIALLPWAVLLALRRYGPLHGQAVRGILTLPFATIGIVLALVLIQLSVNWIIELIKKFT